MADRQNSEEPEEQVDLEGEEDMMDDDEQADEDNARANGVSYRKRRDDSEEPEEAEEDDDEVPFRNPEKRKKITGAGGSNKKAEGADGGEDVQEEEVQEVEANEMEDDGEQKKWAELLSLPPYGSEVFIGGLPRDTTEEDLRELCDSFGEIHEAKLTKDKDTKENKGFAFVTFTTKEAAQSAIEDIQDKEFKGRTLRCSLAQAKHRLFVGNVPKNLTEEELRKIIEEKGPGVRSVEFFKDLHDPTRNRGFLFLEYHNHACAEYAKEKLSSTDFKVDGSALTVSWADPKGSSESSSASQVKTIYVKNLPENVSKEKIKEIFEQHGEVTKIVLPPAKAGHKRDFGFVHFAERSSALKAAKSNEKYEVDGNVLEVSMAKPLSDKKPDHSHKFGIMPSIPSYPPYGGYMGDPYGSYSGGYGAPAYNQPVIYGRGPAPAGMRMVPMMLPDGRLGYVLQQPGAPMHAPPPPRRTDRRDSGGRGDGGRGRRYHPY